MKRACVLIFLCLPLLLCGCAQKSAEREFFAMDTVMQLRAYGPEADRALAEAEAEIYRLEGELSCRDEHAALARLNEAGGGTVSAETAALLQTALTLCEKTGGAYDPALGALSQAWGFSTGAYCVPEQDALAEAMQRSGAAHAALGGCTVTLDGGAQLDLGGIAKGYAADASGQSCRRRASRLRLSRSAAMLPPLGKSRTAARGRLACRIRTGRSRISAPFPLRLPALSPRARTNGILRKTACAIIIF